MLININGVKIEKLNFTNLIWIDSSRCIVNPGAMYKFWVVGIPTSTSRNIGRIPLLCDTEDILYGY